MAKVNLCPPSDQYFSALCRIARLAALYNQTQDGNPT